MKLTKQQLKSLIKECLIELFVDGLGSELYESVKRSPQLRSSPAVSRLNSQISSTPMLQEAVKLESKGDPVLADILADTAMTTLPKQLKHSRADGSAAFVAGDAASMAVAESDPEDLFGSEAASKWASLAFMSK